MYHYYKGGEIGGKYVYAFTMSEEIVAKMWIKS